MVIKNHIAYRFLTDENMTFEILEATHPGEIKKIHEDKGEEINPAVYSLWNLVNNLNQKPYIVTESVIKNLDLLKIEKKGDHYDWTVFKHLHPHKVTFIMPNNVAIRMVITDDVLNFFHLKFEFDKAVNDKNNGHMKWIMCYLDRNTGELCEHFESADSKEIETYIYKFLCFFYLTDNEEIVIQAGKVHGTRKTGKISNDFKFPITIVNSRWNITTIRTEGFSVSGHFRLQPCGEALMSRKLIFIEPFEKNGYIRRAKNERDSK